MNKVENIDLYRDGGSFEFDYAGERYVCMTPLFLIEKENNTSVPVDVYREILLAFKEEMDADEKTEKLMRSRINEAAKALFTVERYIKSLNAEDLK